MFPETGENLEAPAVSAAAPAAQVAAPDPDSYDGKVGSGIGIPL